MDEDHEVEMGNIFIFGEWHCVITIIKPLITGIFLEKMRPPIEVARGRLLLMLIRPAPNPMAGGPKKC